MREGNYSKGNKGRKEIKKRRWEEKEKIEEKKESRDETRKLMERKSKENKWGKDLMRQKKIMWRESKEGEKLRRDVIR